MRCHGQHIHLSIQRSCGNGIDFRLDTDHGFAETVQLILIFALSRFDHNRSSNWEAQRRRMETIIDQSLGHILGTNTYAFVIP